VKPLAALSLIVFVCVTCGVSGAADSVIGRAPAGAAFYAPPAPLPPAAHGDVIWARPLTGAAVLRHAASNTLVLYHTITADGRDVAVSGAIAIPSGIPPSDGWPTISWAHGTTGNAPNCAPTRADAPNSEQRYLDAWVANGFAVVQTDYEGQGTPGLHPYLVGVAAAHDVTDIVRAARELYPGIGTRWFAFGHSEGGSAAIFTAGIGPSWAPELHLTGAVSFAPASHIASLLSSIRNSTRPTASLVFFLEMVEGIASVDPSIDLTTLLTPQALTRLPDLQKRCTDDLMDDATWTSLIPADVFRPDAQLQPLLADFARNESNRVHADVPILLLQGDADDVVPSFMTTLVNGELCANGTRVTYDLLSGKTHGSIVSDSFAPTQAWVDELLANGAPPATCPHTQ
jgi:alpha-beta hydrolase superfamily lysophospholipase